MIRLAVPEIGDEEVAAAASVLRSGFLVQGPAVQAFEAAVAEVVGTRHAVAVSSGTAALHLALLALGIGRDDEVIVPGFTHPATANVVELTGARPVLVDVDLATFNVDPDALARAVGPRTRAVVPVHLFGLPAEMEPILALAAERGLAVIEDAACALGATYGGRPCGSLGRVGCFSFHPRKVITTGEGGLLTTDDDALAERLRRLRNHGQVVEDGRGRFLEAGLNYRLTDVQGAVGVAQMRRLPAILEGRAAVARRYAGALRSWEGATLPTVSPRATPAWQSFVVLLREGVDRDAVQSRLRSDGIETTLGTYALAAQPHYRDHPPLPRSLAAQQRSLALPLHTRLSDADVDAVAAALRRAVEAS
ncbi:MAG TPA: DegT/DnrJ/EryC1/StrS family aminotransferase [Vicinamibacteria bacterium]|nr:DegT/DnrJ/EryC1/StrS family aminotransferase [Vicinamibacteria bacterium]